MGRLQIPCCRLVPRLRILKPELCGGDRRRVGHRGVGIFNRWWPDWNLFPRCRRSLEKPLAEQLRQARRLTSYGRRRTGFNLIHGKRRHNLEAPSIFRVFTDWSGFDWAITSMRKRLPQPIVCSQIHSTVLCRARRLQNPQMAALIGRRYLAGKFQQRQYYCSELEAVPVRPAISSLPADPRGPN